MTTTAPTASRSPLRISVVTPTYMRPDEVKGLLENLTRQEVLPTELVIVDGAAESERRTERLVAGLGPEQPYFCRYLRQAGGTAVQRNRGIDEATGDLIALIDDDIRLAPNFLAGMVEVFQSDGDREIGGVSGYIENSYLDAATSTRWRWYRRLRLFRCYEPGRYDFQTGYPINRYLQPPHEGLREIDFMGAGCAVWRREVFDSGLRFSTFFTGFGVLEDAHLALRAGRSWRLVENGRCRCTHLRSTQGREDARRVAYKTAVNYRYVFVDLVPERTLGQNFRFWLVQFFDLARFGLFAMRHPGRDSFAAVVGKVEGIAAAAWLKTENADPRAGTGG